MESLLGAKVTSRLASLCVATCVATIAPHAQGQQTLEYRGVLTWIQAATYLEPVKDSPFNPDNATFAHPAGQLVSELRPDLKITAQGLQLIARPRYRLTFEQYKEERERTGKGWIDGNNAEGWINEAYGQWTAADGVTVAYGLQNYQWGPAESFSPSNRIFHETVLERTALHETRGRNLARINLTVGRDLSFVLMSEFEENKDIPPFTAGEEFVPTTLGKAEIAWNGGADYLGLVLGAKEGDSPWLGEYVSLSVPFLEGFSIYGDASHRRRSQVWYPVEETQETPLGMQTVIAMRKAPPSREGKDEDDKVQTMAVVGVRYDFEGGTIIRLEGVRNDFGYTEEEHDLVRKALTPENEAQASLLADNLERALAPGLELPGKRYLFASIHAPDLFSVKDLTFYMRSLYSLTDKSSSSYASVRYGFHDAGTLFVASTLNAGKEGELEGTLTQTHTIGYEHVW